ncbi:MAG TPA: DUF1440 domain-containing protein [Candidatus Limnocylindria bacterium]|nr:DUF1440 domain-containing protein [Candidatus Limnocylindria bacterium]
MSSLVWTAFRGAVAGTAATWVMDRVTTRVLEAQSPEDTAREQAAWPNGKPSVENLFDKAAARLKIRLRPDARETAIDLTHYALGAIPGMGYALLRRRVPLLGAGHGLVYGLLLFVINDEFMNTALGLAGPPEAYPASSHVRGLIGHVALGVATDIGLTGA